MRSELDVAASDAARFQSWIRERQYPSDCAATTGFFTRQDYFYKLGLGAQMVSLKFNLLHALLHKKVYHFPTTHYVNPLRCPSRSFDCYFERPSNCTRATHAAAEEGKIHWCHVRGTLCEKGSGGPMGCSGTGFEFSSSSI